MSPAVTFVVCARNNLDIIGECLDAIASQTVRERECILVDGCSEDGTAQHVAREFPWVELIVKRSDTGPADSRNLGARAARAPVVAFVDSDVRLAPEWCEAQLEFLTEYPRVALAGGKLLREDEPAVLDAAFGAMNRLGVAWDAGWGRSSAHYDVPRRCVWLSTSALIVRRHAFERLGGFDAEMFAIHEDTDFGWRANLFGFEVAFNPRAPAWHRVHGTLDHGAPRASFLLWRNRLRSGLVNVENRRLPRFLAGSAGLFAVGILGRPERREILRALTWTVAHLPDTLRRRREVQARRGCPDRALDALLARGARGPGRAPVLPARSRHEGGAALSPGP